MCSPCAGCWRCREAWGKLTCPLPRPARPQGLSIACSTEHALHWDPEWKNIHEISGRAIKAVHESGASFKLEAAEGEDGAAALANGV